MGIQTMGSHGDSGQHSQFLPLSRQTSFYSLTLDEVQNQLGLGGLGKPLGSMNLDELLKNVYTAEAEAEADNEPPSSSSALHRQPSLAFNGNSPLTKKTVDEVWRDIQQGDTHRDKKPQERQPTLGEMTLEDFLVKAGVVSQPSSDIKNAAASASSDLLISNPQQTQWMQYQLPSIQSQHPHQNMMGVFMPTHPVVPDANYSENQMTMSSPLMGTLSDTQTPGRKRGPSGDILEKTVERRQKRMIKNRESAARSRARKQAYTNELENKVSRLEEENERLKKQKELEQMLPYAPPPEPKFQLRRTSSARF